MIVFAAGDVHCLPQTVSHEIDDKFFGLADVAQGVLRLSMIRMEVLRRSQSGSKRKQRRINRDAVEERKRSKIGLPFSTHGRNPCNGTRSYGAQQNVVELTVREL